MHKKLLCYNAERSDEPTSIEVKGVINMKDIHTPSHSPLNCKYHELLAPKYRHKAFYGEKRYTIGRMLRKLCKRKGVNALKAGFMSFPKWKSRLLIYEQRSNIRYKYLNREFRCKGYYGWEKYKEDNRIYPTSTRRRRRIRSADAGGIRPVYGKSVTNCSHRIKQNAIQA